MRRHGPLSAPPLVWTAAEEDVDLETTDPARRRHSDPHRRRWVSPHYYCSSQTTSNTCASYNDKRKKVVYCRVLLTRVHSLRTQLTLAFSRAVTAVFSVFSIFAFLSVYADAMLAAVAFLLFCVSESVRSFPTTEQPKLIDLTYPLNNETIYWPGAQTFRHPEVFAGETENGYYYSAYNFLSAEHGGTHLDAPIHFAEGKETTDQISLQRMIGEGCVIDVSRKADADRDYQITVTDITDWEGRHGRTIDHCIVMFRTDWSKRWPDRKAYLGTDEMNVTLLHFPGIHPTTAKWIVDNRRLVKMVGLDTASLDYGPSTLFETHRTLLGQNIPGLENLMNLDKLPEVGANVIALPMKIEGGSGGPIRVIAIDGQTGYSRCDRLQSAALFASSPSLPLFCISLIASLCLFTRA
uniref:Uncharacterized protein n=1 Tax=Plectus sambesii TaxID=2011161 RepID=A0A914V6Q9_9BILA